MNPQEGWEAARQNQILLGAAPSTPDLAPARVASRAGSSSALDAYPRLDDLATLAKQFTQGNRDIVRNQHDHERHHTADVDRGCAPCDEFGWAGSLIDEPS